MPPIWRSRAGQLLMLCFALDLQELAYPRSARPALAEGGILLWLALRGFLMWRVWRGGPNSWTILLAWNGCMLVLTVLGTSWPWPGYVTGLVLTTVIQLALIYSPSVRRRVRLVLSGLGEHAGGSALSAKTARVEDVRISPSGKP